MKLDADGARKGINEKIADPLKMDVVAAAQAIVEIAIAKMSLAVREVSVAKGYDPRDFALVASGGAGPLHVVAIARELFIPKVVVPCSWISAGPGMWLSAPSDARSNTGQVTGLFASVK